MNDHCDHVWRLAIGIALFVYGWYGYNHFIIHPLFDVLASIIGLAFLAWYFGLFEPQHGEDDHDKKD